MPIHFNKPLEKDPNVKTYTGTTSKGGELTITYEEPFDNTPTVIPSLHTNEQGYMLRVKESTPSGFIIAVDKHIGVQVGGVDVLGVYYEGVDGVEVSIVVRSNDS